MPECVYMCVCLHVCMHTCMHAKIGLFTGEIGLFAGEIGLFTGEIGLFQQYLLLNTYMHMPAYVCVHPTMLVTQWELALAAEHWLAMA